jgi:hypothetical protein
VGIKVFSFTQRNVASFFIKIDGRDIADSYFKRYETAIFFSCIFFGKVEQFFCYTHTPESGSEACKRYEIKEKKITSKTKLKVRMAPSGGFAISIK